MDYKKAIPAEFDPDECTDAFLRDCCVSWRDRQLAATDWTQLSDSPLLNKSDWATYRQQLRDLPSQGSDPKLWVFPERP